MKKRYLGTIVGLILGAIIAYSTTYLGNQIQDATGWIIIATMYFIIPAGIIGYMLGLIKDKRKQKVIANQTQQKDLSH